MVGGNLLSHRVAPAVPSALWSLTSVFGMGTGGTSELSPPTKVTNLKKRIYRYGVEARPRAVPRHSRGGAGFVVVIKPNGQLVLVCSTHCCASTPSLSTL